MLLKYFVCFFLKEKVILLLLMENYKKIIYGSYRIQFFMFIENLVKKKIKHFILNQLHQLIFKI